RIYPEPGKTVVFPCFMVHRIQPIVDNRRWAIVTFIDNPNYKNMNKKRLKSIYKRYFNEYNRN
ncbi:MAG: 2OG-Fe(II) oxygenase, partial [Flavobacteriales bacterium]|nr:2OG-Fe(II) oxygenase [Flavobacteriales bacterium]